MAKDEKYIPKKCKVSSIPVDCDVCGKMFARVKHDHSRCVPDRMPMPKPGEHVTDNPPRWICWRCTRQQNLDRLA